MIRLFPRSPVLRPAGFGLCLAVLAAGGAGAPQASTSYPAFVMPAGCELIVTTQYSDCSAQVAYSCAGSDPGVRHLANIYADGLGYMSSVDATYTWIDGLNLADGSYEVTQFPVLDPIDTDNLQAAGIDAFSLVRTVRETGATLRFNGYDWLTGFDTEIDGVRLLETTFHVRAVAEDGSIFYEAEGTEFLDPDLGLFHQGRTWYDGNTEEVWATAPVEFDFPGEPAAADFTPRFGCE